MEISDLELFNVPLSSPPGDGVQTLICITSSSGLQGWGEAPLAWRTVQLPHLRQALLAALAGRSIFNIADLSSDELMRDAPLSCAIETALWDLIGQTAGQPLCNLWGGVYRPQVPLAARVSAAEVLANPRLAGELVEHGFRHFVLACGGREEEYATVAKTLHESFGLRASLGLDWESRYTPDAALRLSAALGDDALASFIDPIASDNLSTICGLAQIMHVPLSLCRCITSASQATAVIRAGAVQSIFVDPVLVGGLLATKRAVAAATAGGLATSLFLRRSAGIAPAAALHLAASIVQLDRHHVFDGYNAESCSAVQGLRISDGAALVSQLPGVGVAVDRDAEEFAWDEA